VHRGEDGAATGRVATQVDRVSVRPAVTLVATARLEAEAATKGKKKKNVWLFSLKILPLSENVSLPKYTLN
jgi:hypothetical protein